MQSKVTKPDQLDVEQLKFSKVLKNDNNGKMVFINNNKQEKIFVVTDKVWLPKGLSRIHKKDETSQDSFLLDISLKQDDKLF